MLVRFVIYSVLLLSGANVLAQQSYREKSDAELTALASTWETMSSNARRALLTEIKTRMRSSGKRPVVRIHAKRRFGRLVRQPDGRVVRIETEQHVVRYRELTAEEIASKTVSIKRLPATLGVKSRRETERAAGYRAEHGFGLGFEKRVRTQPSPQHVSDLPGTSSKNSVLSVQHQTND
ncbi:MAG: hypothetical protein KUG75_00090 [Pseudomonadales bacterium]|nr:hypothetical protein [Pseudomonadales bacterium]